MKMRFLNLRRNCLAACAATACLAISMTAASSQVVIRPYPADGVVYAPAYYSPLAYSHPVNGLGFYVSGDLGISVLQDFNSSRFGFPGRFSADSGVRFGIEPGFDFLSTSRLTLGAEFETGVIYNYLSSINEAGAPTGLRGDYYQVPLLGNLVLKLHPGPVVTPYIGVGAGGVYSSATIRPNYRYGFWTSSDETDPAVQAMVGIRFQLNPFTEVGLGYKYLATLSGGNRDVATHTVLASLGMDF
jgi:opacity protein-like surface antigen